MSIKIVFTGGGTAGHVTPNLALIEAARKEGWQLHYIGSHGGVEEGMVKAVNVFFHPISSGKLRRYFSWKNFLDPFRVMRGVLQSWLLLRHLDADIVFSKGGFVAFPVVFAAWLRRIPVVAHESDMSPGLANRLSLPFVNRICVNSAESRALFKRQDRVEVTGTPIRSQLFKGSRQAGLMLCNFNQDKLCLLVTGGSLGAQIVNRVIRDALPELNQRYQVIHLCGKGNRDNTLDNNPEYYQCEYASEAMADLLAASDVIVSRAGANTLYEILALKKPHVLIPLSAKASRGDQIQNAQHFEKKQISIVIKEEQFTPQTLAVALEQVHQDYDTLVVRMAALGIESATMKIMILLKEQLRVESPEIIG